MLPVRSPRVATRGLSRGIYCMLAGGTGIMTLVRRFMVLALLMFWLGGFTFYASVVVPVGADVLGSHLRQGMITRHVAWYMNLSGIAALAVFAWDQFSF